MLVNKAYKFRLYPNKAQRSLIAKTIGSPFHFYHFLKVNNAYKQTACHTMRVPLNCLCLNMNSMAKEVDSIAVQTSVKHLAEAFHAF